MKITKQIRSANTQIRVTEIGIIRMEGIDISTKTLNEIVNISSKNENQNKLFMVFDFNTSSRMIDLNLISSGDYLKKISNLPNVPNGVNIYHYLSVVNCPNEFPKEQPLNIKSVPFDECLDSFNDYMLDMDEEYNERFDSSVKEIIEINLTRN